MTKRIVFAAPLALVIAGIAASSASAHCSPAKYATTYNGFTGTANFLRTSFKGSLSATMWSGSTDHTGTCDEHDFGLYYLDETHVYFNVALGHACVPGCPAGRLSIKVVNTGMGRQEFVANGVPENFVYPSANFDFSTVTNTDMVPVGAHRPRVAASSRSPTGATDTVSLSAYHVLGYGDVDNLECLVRSATTPITATSPPPPAEANWPGVLASLPAVNGICSASGPLIIDCSDRSVTRWIAMQYATPAGRDPVVGPATRINCDPALAEPKFRFNPKKDGIGDIRN